MLRSVLLTLSAVLIVFYSMLPTAFAACTVKNPSDKGIGTLRLALEEEGSGGVCPQINFSYPNGPAITYPQSSYFIGNIPDNGAAGGGWNLIITGNAGVLIDGTDLPEDQCVFSIHANHIQIQNLAVKVHHADKAFCDYGTGNDFKGAVIFAEESDGSQAVYPTGEVTVDPPKPAPVLHPTPKWQSEIVSPNLSPQFPPKPLPKP